MQKFKLGKAEKKDIGGTINQVVPPIGLQYIATAPDIADVQSVAALEQARQAAQQKVDAARAAAIPDDKSAQEFFKSAEGLSGEVNSIQSEYNQERNNFYQKVMDDPDYGLSPEGKNHLRKIGNIVSMERINALKNNKETFEQDRKKVNEKGTGDDIFYDDGYVHVEVPGSDQTIKVDASDYYAQRSNPESQIYGARALTINENFNRINSRVANTKGNLPAMSSQLSYQDAVKELEKYFDGIGGTSSETVRDSFDHMGVTEAGKNIPGIATMASKTTGNTNQLAAAVALAGNALSVGARNAFAAELLRRGIDPKSAQKYINVLSSGEALKRKNYEHSEKHNFSPMLGALDSEGGNSDGSFLGFTPAVEVNSSFAADADKGWYNFWTNKHVDGYVVERNDSFPIDQSIQKAVPTNTGMVYKIGGNDDSPSNDGKMVRKSVLENVVQSRPISTYVFTGEELSQDQKKQSRDPKEAGKMLLTGDKGTIGFKTISDVKITPGPNGKEYVFDPEKKVYREVTRRAFKVYDGLDEDGKPTNEKYFVPMSIGESRVIMGKQDRSGELANKQFVTSKGASPEATATMRYLESKRSQAAQKNDAYAFEDAKRKYETVERLYSVITNPNESADTRGKAVQIVNQILKDAYYDAAGESYMNNLPAIKPVASPASVNVFGVYK